MWAARTGHRPGPALWDRCPARTRPLRRPAARCGAAACDLRGRCAGISVIIKGVRVIVKGIRVTIKGIRVTIKGIRVTIKGIRVIIKGIRVITKGVRVIIKGTTVIMKGIVVIIKGTLNWKNLVMEFLVTGNFEPGNFGGWEFW